MTKQKKNDCQDIELLLLKNNIEDLNIEDQKLVEEHLKNCDKCISYYNILQNIQQSAKIYLEENLIPDPAIHYNITKYLKTQKSKQYGLLSNSWQFIKDILEIKIPVYQLVSSAVIIFFIVFAINKLTVTPKYTPNIAPGTESVVDTLLYQKIGIVNPLKVIDQHKLGRTVEEDSAYTKYITEL